MDASPVGSDEVTLFAILMKRLYPIPVITGLLIPHLRAQLHTESRDFMNVVEHKIKLPKAREKGKMTVEEALLRRRSVREYSDVPLTIPELSQLLWAAQGVTSGDGYRTTPSAGALYPLEVYAVVGKVSDLPSGIYKYDPCTHEVRTLAAGDKRSELSRAALDQGFITEAPASLVFSAVYERTTWKYGTRGKQYTHMEVGHAAQNVYLQAAALDLGTVVVGAFHDDRVKKLLQMAHDEEPVCIMPVLFF